MPDRQKCTRSKTSVFPRFFPYPEAERNSVDYVYFNKKSAVSWGFFAIFRDLPALIYVFIYKPYRHGAQVENLCAFYFTKEERRRRDKINFIKGGIFPFLRIGSPAQELANRRGKKRRK